jgi:hypothetical protein
LVSQTYCHRWSTLSAWPVSTYAMDDETAITVSGSAVED